LIRIKAGGEARRHGSHLMPEIRMITPFLVLVLTGYAAFMGVLGGASLYGYVADVRDARASRRREPRPLDGLVA
jgi:hypothetical protein